MLNIFTNLFFYVNLILHVPLPFITPFLKLAILLINPNCHDNYFSGNLLYESSNTIVVFIFLGYNFELIIKMAL